MSQKLEPDFILHGATAQALYEGSDALRGLRRIPIVDVHTHTDGSCRTLPHNAWDLLVGPDHYKTQLMYLNGISVDRIEGSACNPQENWRAFAGIFHQAIGTVVYDSTMAILRRIFHWNGSLNADTADAVWNRVQEYLSNGTVTLSSLINGGDPELSAGVIETIATCDTPWLANPDALTAPVEGVSQSPFRLGMRIEPLAFPQKFARLSAGDNPLDGLATVAGSVIQSADDYLHALELGIKRFAEYGNTSLDFSMWGNPQVYPVSTERATEILRKAQDKAAPEGTDEQDFLAFILPHFFRLAYANNLPLQLKIGVVREVNPNAPTNAHDSVDEAIGLNGLVPLLQEYEDRANVDGKDWSIILSVRNRYNYQQQADLSSAFRILYWGGDWWDNDNVEGMEEGLYQRARWRGGVYRGVMFFSDTRSFPDCLTRFDMKKRVLANYLGNLVDSRMVTLEDAARIGYDSFYTQPKRLFGL